MKKVLLICSFTIAVPLLLANCGKSKQHNNDAEIQAEKPINDKGNIHMSNPKIQTDSGLEYIILQEGTGETPVKGKTVTVHYTGWLDVNGEPGPQFDSSVERKQPFSFIIGKGQVIQGWEIGVLPMKVGEKRRLFIPANLGYGAYGAGRVIPPNAKLIFDVELLKIS